MLTAVQGTDLLMGGLHSVMETLADRASQRREIQEQAYDSRLTAWERYADRLENMNDQLRMALAAKNKDYATLQEQAKHVNEQSIDYMATLIRRIERLDERLQRESANSHSMTAMRDVLLAEVMAFGDPTKFSSLDPDKRAEVMEDAWRDFMENSNVRLGTPKRTP